MQDRQAANLRQAREGKFFDVNQELKSIFSPAVSSPAHSYLR